MRTTMMIAASGFALLACGGEGAGTTDTTTAAGDTAAGAPATGAPAGDTGAPAAPGQGATAQLRDAAGRDLGTLTLAEGPQGITVSGTLRGLPPGEHAIHVHTTGQCEPPFESAGGHWNPTGRQHGSQNPQGPHLGDMPNVTVGADSTANVQVTTAGGTLRGANALLDGDGAAVVVHAGPDDYRTDPSGNSGPRVACGAVTGG